jgi:hypothetical protein
MSLRIHKNVLVTPTRRCSSRHHGHHLHAVAQQQDRDRAQLFVFESTHAHSPLLMTAISTDPVDPRPTSRPPHEWYLHCSRARTHPVRRALRRTRHPTLYSPIPNLGSMSQRTIYLWTLILPTHAVPCTCVNTTNGIYLHFNHLS